jgi:hypothetical protein
MSDTVSITGASTDALARRLPCTKSRGGSGDRGSSIRNLIEVGNGDGRARGASRAVKGGSAWSTR